MTDEVGTSTVVNTTDRRLNAVNDVIETANHATGAVAVQVDFHHVQGSPALTTINGSDLLLVRGPAMVSGSTYLVAPGGIVRSAALTLTAGIATEVQYFLKASAAGTVGAKAWIRDMTSDKVVTSLIKNISNTSSPTRMRPAVGRSAGATMNVSRDGLVKDVHCQWNWQRFPFSTGV